ncbi:MAG: hypothetical protein ACLKAL_11865 [Alkaliphilus sp.]
MKKMLEKLVKLVKGVLGNKKGSNVVTGIIITAIVLIAIIALAPTITTFFANVWNQFAIWVTSRLTALFSPA